MEPMTHESGLPVLVSACLGGRRCTHKGTDNHADGVQRLMADGRAVLVCPEEDGGLPTPRPPAEIQGGDGDDVLDGRARVVNINGHDVTDEYLRGADIAVQRALAAGARTAVLKARSPSCGCGQIYDGSFSKRLVDGVGITAAALLRAGIRVVTDEAVDRGALADTPDG
jgi:uncharacterized protein YbbK (DUF523 family)